MHGFGLCDGIIEAVQKRANGRPVQRVCIQVGILHGVSSDAFRQAFSHAADGTEAENALVDLVLMPVLAGCRTCQTETQGDDIVMVCPQCGGRDLELTGGDELVLESIEYEGQQRTSWLGKE